MPGFHSPTRRSVLGGLLVGALACPAYIRPGWAQGKRIVVANFGGAARDAKRKAIYDPFTAATGIEVIYGEGPDMAKMKIQVENKDVEWDIIDMNDAWVQAAGRMGLLEEIDETIVNREGCLPIARNKFACGGNVYAGGIAFPTDRLNGKVATTWPEFWDVEKVPGRRGLRNRVTDNLEIALMAVEKILKTRFSPQPSSDPYFMGDTTFKPVFIPVPTSPPRFNLAA